MNRKLIYTFSLIGFFVLWGVFGFAAGAPRNDSVSQSTPAAQDSTVIVPAVTAQAAIPVTGDPKMETEVLLVYLFFGLVALFIILALLNAANKPRTTYVPPKEPPDRSS